MLETPNQLSEQARNNLRDSYNQLHAGVDNTGKLMLLEEGLKFTQSQYTNEQSQYIEILDRIVFDVARFLVIPPPKLKSLEQATWANITELNRAQADHHRFRNFREELVELLQKAGVEYEDRYLD